MKQPRIVDLANALSRAAKDMDCAARLLETCVPYSAVHYRIAAKRMRETAARALRSV